MAGARQVDSQSVTEGARAVSGLQLVKPWPALLAIAVLDTLAIGAGMGVPIFAILLGFPVGWWLARRHASKELTRPILRSIFRGALVPTAITFVLMLAIWAPQFSLLAKPGFDVASWGIPMLLYTPLASFYGWMALMIVVSPALQLLATVFGAYLTLLAGERA